MFDAPQNYSTSFEKLEENIQDNNFFFSIRYSNLSIVQTTIFISS